MQRWIILTFLATFLLAAYMTFQCYRQWKHTRHKETLSTVFLLGFIAILLFSFFVITGLELNPPPFFTRYHVPWIVSILLTFALISCAHSILIPCAISHYHTAVLKNSVNEKRMLLPPSKT